MTPLLAILGLAAQAGVVPAVSVATAKRELSARDGQVVRVRGWISERCYHLGCSLLPRPQPTRDGEPRLSLAFEPALEPAVLAKRGAEVVIEGVLDATCLRFICTDRAPELRPRRIFSASRRPLLSDTRKP